MRTYELNPQFSPITNIVLMTYSQALEDESVERIRELSYEQKEQSIQDLIDNGYECIGGYTGPIVDAKNELENIAERYGTSDISRHIGPCALGGYGIWRPVYSPNDEKLDR